jgi:hypothetical protein
MNNINHLQSELEYSIGEDSLKRIQQFLLVFSRFEFALQNQGLVYNHKFANWRTFAKLLDTSFDEYSSTELRGACYFMKASPPNEYNGTTWKPLVLSSHLSLCQKLMRYITTIRNNLFHGGKVRFELIRDPNLIQSALIILDYCISISPANIQAAFWSGLTPP